MIPNDVNLTNALTAESIARAGNLKSNTTRNILFGSAALVGATGVGLALIIAAWNNKADVGALNAAISEMRPLKVEPLQIKDGSVVHLAPDATVKIAGLEEVPRLNVSNQPQKTNGGDAIKHEVTMFSSVKHNDGEVVSGWNYASGDAKSPYKQYCYYGQPKPNGTLEQVSLGNDGKPVENNTVLPDFAVAFAKCVWWKGV